jgi:PAS domain S-box-containing protein
VNALRTLLSDPLLSDVGVDVVSDEPSARHALRENGGTSVPIVLIGSEVSSPLAAARQLRRDNQSLSILFLLDADRHESFARMLPFVPELHGARVITKAADAGELRRLLMGAFASALRQSEVALVRDYINRRLSQPSNAHEAHQQHLLSQSYLTTLLTSTPDAIFAADQDGKLLAWNEATSNLFGVRLDDGVVGRDASSLFPLDLQPETERLLSRVKSGEVVREHHTRIARPDGTMIDVEISVAPVYVQARQLGGISVTARDITERKQAQRRQSLLINELNHRVKNTLATVQSLVQQTLRNAPDPSAFEADLMGRLIALSRTHDLLTQSSWEGAFLNDVLDVELAPYGGSGEPRYELKGPRVYLPSQAVLSLGLVSHELATNAAKYGAFSRPEGRVRISWTQDRLGLRIEWIEWGGPPVAVPTRRGFGSRLIERSIKNDLGGEFLPEFRPEGFRAIVNLPAEQMPGGYVTP